MFSGMKQITIDGKVKIEFQDAPPGAVPDAPPLGPTYPPPPPYYPPPVPGYVAYPPAPDVKEEVLDAVRNILGRCQEDDATRLEDGLGLLGRRFEGELRNIHERLDQQDDRARATRKRVKKE